MFIRRSKKKNLFGIILLIFTICTILTGCRKEKKGELVLVTEAGFAPYEYYSNGKIVGVDIDIARKIADYLNKELVIKDVAFDSIINEVKTKKSDIGAAGISYTEERAMEVDFTVNYASSRQVIIVKNDSLITDANNLQGKVAVQLGTIADSYLTEKYPNITLIREKKFLAAIQDLKDNKVDAVVMDELPAKKLITKDMIILPNPLVVDNYGMVISKDNKELLNSCNIVIEQMKNNGEIDNIILNHMGIDQKVNKNTIFDRIYNSIILDGRYKYILTGLLNTLIIALGAVIIGVFLGTLLAIIRNYHDNTNKLKLLNAIARLYITIIRGTPSILQLMIIYYVIFKSVSINIVLVGILAFGINSAAYVAEIIRAGLNSVNRGQIEAGYALGLDYKKVIRYIVLPQAIKNIIPALGNEFITLVKETSVGAYIGIVELTKASDIIASRTYDYFFPLILIAIIYLIITYGLSKIVNLIEKRLKNVKN